jgi:hypothetical protein
VILAEPGMTLQAECSESFAELQIRPSDSPSDSDEKRFAVAVIPRIDTQAARDRYDAQVSLTPIHPDGRRLPTRLRRLSLLVIPNLRLEPAALALGQVNVGADIMRSIVLTAHSGMVDDLHEINIVAPEALLDVSVAGPPVRRSPGAWVIPLRFHTHHPGMHSERIELAVQHGENLDRVPLFVHCSAIGDEAAHAHVHGKHSHHSGENSRAAGEHSRGDDKPAPGSPD